MADRVRFELTDDVNHRRISRPQHSTALPSIRIGCVYIIPMIRLLECISQLAVQKNKKNVCVDQGRVWARGFGGPGGLEIAAEGCEFVFVSGV